MSTAWTAACTGARHEAPAGRTHGRRHRDRVDRGAQLHPDRRAQQVRAQAPADVAGEMGEIKRALLPLLCQIHRLVSAADFDRYLREQRQGVQAKDHTPSP